MKKLKSKKNWITQFEEGVQLLGDAEVLLEFYEADEGSETEVDKQLDKAESAIEKLEFRNMLSDEGDEMTAVLQITAGAGGTESCDWAAMLMRMYTRWAERQGYKVEIIEVLVAEGDIVAAEDSLITLESYTTTRVSSPTPSAPIAAANSSGVGSEKSNERSVSARAPVRSAKPAVGMWPAS